MSKYVLKVWVTDKYTVNIYGKVNPTDPGGINLYYGVNDANAPNDAGGLTTSSALKVTLYVAPNDTVSVTNNGINAQCSNIGSYCTFYECPNPSDSFVITADTDIYVHVDGNTAC